MSTGAFNPNAIQGGVFGSATLNPTNLADGAGETLTASIPGAAVGDFVLVAPGVNLAGITVTAWVSAADTVSVRVQNESGGALDLASSTWRIAVLKIGRAF